MSRKHVFAALGICLALVALCHCFAAVAPAAAPQYKALIVNGQNGHDWKGTTPVLKKLLEDTGLFTVDVATSPPKGQDMSGFKPNFAAYNVVVSNYQGDAWPEETKKALVDYVQGGGGLVIYHFAWRRFPDWKEYNEMIGLGGWGGRNEKAGPYVRWRDGKIVRDDSPGQDRRPRPDAALPDRHPRAQPPDHQGPAREVHARARRALRLAPRPGQEPDRAGHGLRPEGEGRRRRARADAVHHRSTARAACSRTPWATRPRSCKSVAFIVTFQRGAEWAATRQGDPKSPRRLPHRRQGQRAAVTAAIARSGCGRWETVGWDCAVPPRKRGKHRWLILSTRGKPQGEFERPEQGGNP